MAGLTSSGTFYLTCLALTNFRHGAFVKVWLFKNISLVSFKFKVYPVTNAVFTLVVTIIHYFEVTCIYYVKPNNLVIVSFLDNKLID